MNSLRWAAALVLASAALALPACTGGATPSTPAAPASAPVAAHLGKPHITFMGARAKVPACPTGFLACGQFSISNGTSLTFCIGSPSGPCGGTSNYSWGFGVCKIKTLPCTIDGGPGFIKAIQTHGGGPYVCYYDSSACGGSITGTFIEVDLTAAKKKPPALTQKYAYKLDVEAWANNQSLQNFVGLSVGP